MQYNQNNQCALTVIQEIIERVGADWGDSTVFFHCFTSYVPYPLSWVDGNFPISQTFGENGLEVKEVSLILISIGNFKFKF